MYFTNSLPLKIDAEQPNLGKLHATRRVARTIYLGSAPTTAAAHRGLEDRRVTLGCVMPGESPAVFGMRYVSACSRTRRTRRREVFGASDQRAWH
jgi:hypothetical protein